eukprot:TRINITY_DN48935_c0_g1_i1.p1 TRINITY_DN48935_c0_g1~~TRINITY_DN48935_c0_g1_i1.p1  ORF type:complete len:308 (+),score=46.75 TRINITY_DN48935_c0_g1_i1:96-1019(+)
MSFAGYGDGPDYWNERYKLKEDTFEWILKWQDVSALFGKYVPVGKQCRILHAGCGNSLLAEEMLLAGYSTITSIDNSELVIDKMARRAEQARTKDAELRWLCMDALDMAFSDESFDVVIEKSLLDCLACYQPSLPAMSSYLKEVIRVLVCGGIFFCISLEPSREQFFQNAPFRFQILEAPIIARRHRVYVCQTTDAKRSLLLDWPDLIDDIRCGLTAEDLAVEDKNGPWMPIETLQVQDVVLIAEELWTTRDNHQLLLRKGLKGVVRIIDEEGDAVIRFPRCAKSGCVDHFILSEDTHHLKVLQSRA